MTTSHAVLGFGLAAALLGALAGCSSGANAGAVVVSTQTSPAPSQSGSGTGPKQTATAKAGPFGGSAPVSIATWWQKHPDQAPADLDEYDLLFNEKGKGTQVFTGPDVRKYDRLRMILTCTDKVEYSLRLQVLDGLSIASTLGSSCGGPEVDSYVSPSLEVEESATQVQVEVPAETAYYVTVYGSFT